MANWGPARVARCLDRGDDAMRLRVAGAVETDSTELPRFVCKLTYASRIKTLLVLGFPLGYTQIHVRFNIVLP